MASLSVLQLLADIPSESYASKKVSKEKLERIWKATYRYIESIYVLKKVSIEQASITNRL